MSHDVRCDTCGVEYDWKLAPHVCDPARLVEAMREEFRDDLRRERSRIAKILRDEVATGTSYVVALAVRRIADAIEEDE